MKKEFEIFYRRRPDFSRLEKFGFDRIEAGFIYRERLMDELAAEVVITFDGATSCRVVDLDTGDEYAAVNVEAQVGEYVGTARLLYREALQRVAASCYYEVHFASDQANRVEALIRAEFHRSPEFVFSKDPGIGVFRHGHNGKWFGIIMPVLRGRLEGGIAAGGPNGAAAGGPNGVAAGDPDELIEIINVKTDPAALDELLKTRGIYRCFHMNKKQWISIALDGSVPDEYVMAMVSFSHEMTKRGAPAKRRRGAGSHGDAGDFGGTEDYDGRKYWIIPSNPKYYDVEKGFRDSGCDTLTWHQRIHVLPGDVVYIYQTEPVGSIKFRCEVTEAGVPRRDKERAEEGLAPKSTEIMYLKRTDTYETGAYSRAWMNEHGIVKTVRGQRSAPDELVAELETLGDKCIRK